MGKTAVVTGGGSGIGRVTALKLAAGGADIVIIHMDPEEKAAEVVKEIEALGVKAKAIRMNVADFEAVKETVAEIVKEFGSIDILINCAGITRDGLIAMMKEDQFDAVIGVNLKGAFNMIRHCTGLFIRNREGCIITLSSHMPNFSLGGDGFFDYSPNFTEGNIGPRILPGGDLNEKYLRFLDKIAEFAADCVDVNGEPIPMLFRPFHEDNGDWFGLLFRRDMGVEHGAANEQLSVRLGFLSDHV